MLTRDRVDKFRDIRTEDLIPRTTEDISAASISPARVCARRINSRSRNAGLGNPRALPARIGLGNTFFLFFLNAAFFETNVEVLEKRIASLHHYSDCSSMNSHTRVTCNFSNCRPLYSPSSPFSPPPGRFPALGYFPRSYGVVY